jgi:hypothetical protein
MKKQYLHLSAYSCDNCRGPVVSGSLAVRENEISKETDIQAGRSNLPVVRPSARQDGRSWHYAQVFSGGLGSGEPHGRSASSGLEAPSRNMTIMPLSRASKIGALLIGSDSKRARAFIKELLNRSESALRANPYRSGRTQTTAVRCSRIRQELVLSPVYLLPRILLSGSGGSRCSPAPMRPTRNLNIELMNERAAMLADVADQVLLNTISPICFAG